MFVRGDLLKALGRKLICIKQKGLKASFINTDVGPTEHTSHTLLIQAVMLKWMSALIFPTNSTSTASLSVPLTHSRNPTSLRFGQLWSKCYITHDWYNDVPFPEVCGCIYLFIFNNNVCLYETATEEDKN